MRSKTRVIKRAITAALLGLALMLSALSATAQTYDFEPETGTFTSIRDNSAATRVHLNPRDDEIDDGVFDTINIPFEFYFFGQRITSLVPTTNLWLTTNTIFECTHNVGSCHSPDEDQLDRVILDSDGANDFRYNHRGAIYPFWTDSSVVDGGQVHYLTRDNEDSNVGGRILIIEYNSFPASFSTAGSLITLQVRLFEANGNIEFRFGPLINSQPLAKRPAFIGIAGSATFLTDSDTTRYYSVQSLSPASMAPMEGETPLHSDETFMEFLITREDEPNTDHDDRFPIDGQIYRFTPDLYLPPPADITAAVSTNTTPYSISRVLPEAVYGKGTVTYALAGLPEDVEGFGITFDATTRTLSGTSTVARAAITLTYTATDDLGDTDENTSAAVEQSFTLTIDASATDSMTAFADDAAISSMIPIQNTQIEAVTLPEPTTGNAPFAYSISPNLPDGIYFNPRNRVLEGAPTTPQSAITYTYKATDIDGHPNTLMFDITILADIRLNIPAPSQELYILETDANVSDLGLMFPSVGEVGGNPPVTLAYTRTFPDFDTISDPGNSSFLLDGIRTTWLSITDLGDLEGTTPTDEGDKNESVPQFSIIGTYTDAGGERATHTFNIQVIDVMPLPPSPEIGEDDFVFNQGEVLPPGVTLPPFRTNVDDVEEIDRPDLTYTLTGLPLGLDFDSTSRVLSGTPTDGGITEVTYEADDRSQKDRDDESVTFSITVLPDVLSFVGQPIEDLTLTQNTAITEMTLPKAIGKDIPLGYSISPALPMGLSFDANSRVLSGTPRVDLTSTEYTYTVTDSGTPAQTTSLTFNITVFVDLMPTFASDAEIEDITAIVDEAITSVVLPKVVENSNGESIGTGVITYSIMPPLPQGLEFDDVSGSANFRELSGTPTEVSPTTTYTYAATDSDTEDADTAMLTFMITVEADTTPMAPSGPQALVFAPGQQGVSETLDPFTGGNGMLTYSSDDVQAVMDDFGLTYDPGTLMITDNISIADTPASDDVAAETYTYTATDRNGSTADATFTIEVVDALPVAPAPMDLPTPSFSRDSTTPFRLPDFTTTVDDRNDVDAPDLTYRLKPGHPTWLSIPDENDPVLSAEPTSSEALGDLDVTYIASDGADEAEATFTLTVTDDPVPIPPVDFDGAFTFRVGQVLPAPMDEEAEELPVFTISYDEDGSSLTHTLTDDMGNALEPADTLIGGLMYDSTTRTIHGEVMGTPNNDDTTTVTYTYSAIETEDRGEENRDTESTKFTIAIVDDMPSFATGPTIDPISGTQGTAIGTILPLPAVESEGSGGITYIFDPMLPAGLTFNQSTRVISGTPSAGLPETTFTYRARDVDGDITPQSFSFTITIEATGDPVVMPLMAPTIPDGGYTFTVGQTLANPIVLPVFTGGNAALTYSLVDAEGNAVTTLVGGLMFAPNSREITGPVEDDTSANDNAAETYTYTATDGSATATVNFTITITDADGLVPPTPQQRLTFNPDGEEVTMTLDEFTGGSGTIMYSSDDVDEVLMDFGLTFNAAARTISGSIPVGTMSKEMEYTYTATSGNEMGSATFTIAITDVPPLVEVTANAIPTVGANIALVASQAISSRVELALDGLSSGIDIRTLDGPSLRLNPQQQSGGSGSPVRFGVWYSAASDSLSDTRGDVTWSGDTDSTNLGFDVGFDISASTSLVVGILQNSSSTSATYRSTATGSTGSGTLSVDLDSTAFYVGLGYDWLDAWFANGSADSTLNDSETMLAIPASFSYQTIGLTASFEIIDSLSVGGKVESLTSDLSLAAMADDTRFEDGLATDSSQLRTAFVANYQLKLGEKGNGLLIPKFEFGFRDLSLGSSITNDATAVGGSAMETGFGIDYIQRAWGLTVGLDMRSISVENYSSDSTQYQIRWESGNYGNGLSFQLTPHSVSETLGGIDSLYSGDYDQYQNLLQRQRGGDSTQDSKGMDFEVGYGFVAGYGTVTPYLKTTNYRGSGNKAEEFGIRYQTLSGLELTLTAERSLTPQTIQILGFPLTFMQDENALTFNTRYSF